MNGAEKIINAMKQVTKSGQNPGSKIVTATVISTKPLTFQLENRLKLTKEFYRLSNLEDWNNVSNGEVFTAFSYDDGQTYYIQESYPPKQKNNPNEINREIDKLKEEIQSLKARVSALEARP